MSLTHNSNKYSYSNLENEEVLYIFEIVLTTINNKYITIRKIKKKKIGKLFSIKENINYNIIQSIKVEVLDLNNPAKNITINGFVNTNKKNNILVNNKIKINLAKIINNRAICEYYIH